MKSQIFITEHPKDDERRCSSCLQTKKKIKFYKYQRVCRSCAPDLDKYKKNLSQRIAKNIRARINSALQGKSKFGHSIELLGCSIEQFKIHLESKFTSEMSWENYGAYWEIDHIKPCALFDLSIRNQQEKCFHYSNMQPLTKSENRRKQANF